MKKIITLFFALIMLLSLVACGSQGTTQDTTLSSADVQAAELENLKDSANALGALYNEIIPIADANGWLQDDTFSQEANATSAMVQVAGEIYADPSMLEGESAQDVIDGIDDMITEWDTNIRAKVSEVYVVE